MLRVERFPVGKGRTLDQLNRTWTERGIRRANIVNVDVQQIGRDLVDYFVTYDDTTTPFVVVTYPGNGDTNVVEGTTLIIAFSEPMAVIGSASIEIYNVTTAAIVSGGLYTLDNSNISDAQGILRILDTGPYLVANTIYRVTIQTSVQDAQGQTMEEDYVFSFSTASSEIFDPGSVTTLTLTAGEALATGEWVRISANNTVVKAIATSANHFVVGAAAEAIASSANGKVTTLEGSRIVGAQLVTGLTLSAGNRVYLSTVTSGALTNVIPVGPAVLKPVGLVLDASTYTGISAPNSKATILYQPMTATRVV